MLNCSFLGGYGGPLGVQQRAAPSLKAPVKHLTPLTNTDRRCNPLLNPSYGKLVGGGTTTEKKGELEKLNFFEGGVAGL